MNKKPNIIENYFNVENTNSNIDINTNTNIDIDTNFNNQNNNENNINKNESKIGYLNKILKSQSCSNISIDDKIDKEIYFIKVPSTPSIKKSNSLKKIEILKQLSKSHIEREEMLKKINNQKTSKI